jgi:hypothetical protein
MAAEIPATLPRATQAVLARLGHEWRLFLTSARTIGKELSKDPAGTAVQGREDPATLEAGMLMFAVDEVGENLRVLLDEPGRELGLYLCWLRLPALQERWERLLRRNHLESLKKVLPDAWILDPTPVPPGAVIRGLEISEWSELKRQQVVKKFTLLNDKNKQFIMDNTQISEDWFAAVHDALATFSECPSLLIERPFGTQVFRAEYMANQGRVVLKSLTPVQPEMLVQTT